ncbi:MAG: L-2-hydroxyglutarate oxidase LhgO [Paraglaciecola sp.]|jgi:L-2-hydroxyglutarate oxidase LhgO
MNYKTDIVVIGAGIISAATAWHLLNSILVIPPSPAATSALPIADSIVQKLANKLES